VMSPLGGGKLVGDGCGGDRQGEARERGDYRTQLKHGALDVACGPGISVFTRLRVLGTLPRTNITYAHHSGAD